MIFTSTEIVCPAGKPNSKTIVIDLKEISRIESRIQEIQIFTKEKAPELLACFTLAWKDLHQNIVVLTKELSESKRNLEKIRGRLILEEIPKDLERRGLVSARSPGGSADQREAALTQYEEYNLASERQDEIQAVIELLRGKLIALDMAYTSVKKLITENNNGMYSAPGHGVRSGYGNY